MALGHVSAGEIADIDERSAEADACSLFYAISLEATLRAWNWKFARRTEALALVEEDPTTEWAYSYRYPTGCLAARRIPSGVVPESQDDRIPFDVGADDEGQLIYTDRAEAELEYTKLIEDTTRFPSDFALALSFHLASLIAPKLTAGDPFKLGDKCMARFAMQIGQAELAASRETQAPGHAESEFIRVRG